jgi:hypothetical protein
MDRGPGPLAAAAPGELFQQLWPWLAALALLVAVGGVAIWLVRRWLGRSTGSGSAGFSLQELRQLHAQGRLTDGEFERAKASIIGRVKGAELPPSPDARARACNSPGMVEPLDPGDESPID